MRVATNRWGEITIKKQGSQKNQFDKSKSFSIQNTKYEYTIDQLRNVLVLVINLSEEYPYPELKKRLAKDKGGSCGSDPTK